MSALPTGYTRHVEDFGLGSGLHQAWIRDGERIAPVWRPVDYCTVPRLPELHGLRMDIRGDEHAVTARVYVTEDRGWVHFASSWHHAGYPLTQPARPVSMPDRRVVYVGAATTTPEQHPHHAEGVAWVRREAQRLAAAWLRDHHEAADGGEEGE